MKELIIELTGTSPLLMHNERLADPDGEHTKAIKAITDKRKKSEEDRVEVRRIEWFGGLYADDNGPIMPTKNVRACLIEAAKVRRLGKDITRSVIPTAMSVPLVYDGPRDVQALHAKLEHRWVCMVGNKGNRIPRCRPCFPTWSVQVPVMLVTETMDLEVFENVVHLAGVIEGLGDGRLLGFGRFTAVIKETA